MTDDRRLMVSRLRYAVATDMSLLIVPVGRPQDVDAAPEQASGEKATDGPRVSGNGTSLSKSKEDKATQPPKAVDPLEGMPQDDRYGLKGLRTMMNNYPDFHATVVGIDPVSLGLDLTTQE